MGGWKLTTSEWHNPFKVPKGETSHKAVQQYLEYIPKQTIFSSLGELQGHVLGCFCPVEKRSLSDILAGPICHNEGLLGLIFYRWYNYYSSQYPDQSLSYTVYEIPVQVSVQNV